MLVVQHVGNRAGEVIEMANFEARKLAEKGQVTPLTQDEIAYFMRNGKMPDKSEDEPDIVFGQSGRARGRRRRKT